MARKAPLTDAAVRTAKGATKPYKLTDGGGLFLYVTPAGGRHWRLKCRFQSREQLLSFGSYPAVGLGLARERRDDAKRLLAQGKNPSLEKRRVALATKTAGEATFNKVAVELISKRLREGLAETTATKLRWYLDLLGPLHDRPVGEIEAFEILDPLRKVEASGRNESAVNALAFAGRVFRFAVATGRAKRDVAADLKGALTTPKVTHRAAVTDAVTAGRLIRSIDAYGGQKVIRLGLMLLAHVYSRPGELRLAEWPEFDFDAAVWRIPGERTKQRRPHHVPLSRQALAILGELQTATGGKGYVLPSLRSRGRTISENTFNVALRAMGWGKDEVTAHGLRAMASTLLNESGQWSPDAIERALAHADTDAVRGAYHRGQHWEERVRMAQWWSDYLDTLRDGAEIVTLRANR